MAELSSAPVARMVNLPSPKLIDKYLNKYVEGQETATKTLSIALHNHYKRINNISSLQNVYKRLALDEELNHKTIGPKQEEKLPENEGRHYYWIKTNAILWGPSGTGKTLLASTAARFLNVPFAVLDCGLLKDIQQVDKAVNSTIRRLLASASMKLDRAQLGIVLLESFDEVIKSPQMQRALLDFIRGKDVRIAISRDKTVAIDSRNLYFIATGCFHDIKDMVQKRPKSLPVNFHKSVAKTVIGCDFMRLGLIPELMRHFPVTAELIIVDPAGLKDILTNTLLPQYKDLYSMSNTTLWFTPSALDAIVMLAQYHGGNVSSLTFIIESILHDSMYDIPDSDIEHVVISSDVVFSHSKASYTLKENDTTQSLSAPL